jgi:hypothetical protein
MTISWLTPISNSGEIVAATNWRRCSCNAIVEGTLVGLSVPVDGMEDIVRQCGTGSGRFGGRDGLSCKLRRLIESGTISLLDLTKGVVGVAGCSVFCIVQVMKVSPSKWHQPQSASTVIK